MQLSAKDLWSRLLEDALRELSEQTIRTWLEPAAPISLENGTLTVGAPDQFAVQWNESKHAAVLSRLAEKAAGQPVAVVFQVAEERIKRPQMDLFVAPTPSAAATVTRLNPSAQPL